MHKKKKQTKIVEKKETEFLHIELTPTEYISHKRNCLKLEMESLNLLKSIKSYKEIRKMEISLKIMIQKRIKQIKNNLKSIQEILPELKNKTIKKEEINEKNQELYSQKSIDEQLQEIQSKLSALQIQSNNF